MPKKKRGRPFKVEDDAFKVTFTMGSEVYMGEGQTILAALQAIPRPTKITVKGIFEVSDGVRSKTILAMPLVARRYFYPQSQPTLAKYLTTVLK